MRNKLMMMMMMTIIVRTHWRCDSRPVSKARSARSAIL